MYVLSKRYYDNYSCFSGYLFRYSDNFLDGPRSKTDYTIGSHNGLRVETMQGASDKVTDLSFMDENLASIKGYSSYKIVLTNPRIIL